MDAVEIMLRAVGAFYAFAGYAGTRAGLMSHLLDVALAGITLKKPPRADLLRSAWLLGASTLVLVGGLALVLLLDWAAWLFVASSAGQLAYLTIAAPYYFDREDPPDAKGRQQTLNAFILYVAATGFVAWGYAGGKLQPWTDVHPIALAAAAVALAAHVAYLARSLAMPRKPAFGSNDFGSDEPPADPATSKRIKVMADYHCHPLWALDDDLYGDFPPDALGLSPELSSDLDRWAEAFTASLNPDEPTKSLWTPEQVAAHDAEGRRLAQRLANARPDLTIFAFDRGIGVVAVAPTGGRPTSAD